MKFTCPQCKADVTKEEKEPLGCPCCGYAAQGVAPYVPNTYPYPIWVVPPQPWWNPYSPVWVGDPPYTGDGTVAPINLTPQITWGTDFNTNKITVKQDPNLKVSYISGQATA